MKALLFTLALGLAGFTSLAFFDNQVEEARGRAFAMDDIVPLDGECGDVNGDGLVNIVDVILGLRFANDDSEANDTQRRVGDTDLNGVLDIEDARMVVNSLGRGLPVSECGFAIEVKDGAGSAGSTTSVEVVLHHATLDVSAFTISVRPVDPNIATISDVEFTQFTDLLCQAIVVDIPPLSDSRKNVTVLDGCNDLVVDTSPQTLFVINLDLLTAGTTGIELEIGALGSAVPVVRELKNAIFVTSGTIEVTEP